MKNNKTKNPAFIIAHREISAYFVNPAAYIVSAFFLVSSGVLFFSTFFIYNRAELRGFFSLLPYLLSIFIPALTMRLFSEEKRSGSIETLLTLPVTEVQVVFGKFLAAIVMSVTMILPTLFYVITAMCFGAVDFGPVVGGYVGAIFLCASYSAIGLFSSSITKNQIVSFFVSLAINLTLTLLSQLLLFLPPVLVQFFSYISISTHFSSISRGIVDSRDIIYFASLIAIFLLLTIQYEKDSK